MRPSITIHIADRGTERRDNTPALVGHAWYVLNDGNGLSRSYGFAQGEDYLRNNPSILSKFFAPGSLRHNDDTQYLSRAYSREIELSEAQYRVLKEFSENPFESDFPQDYNAFTNSCIDFVWFALRKAGISPTNFEGDIWPAHNIEDIKSLGKPIPAEQVLWSVDPFSGLPRPRLKANEKIPGRLPMFGSIGIMGAIEAHSASTRRPIDPLALDLDGDGIETTGIHDARPILFDHDDDGIMTGTGWLRPDDGWLVLDRNDNGSIDSGRELFGVGTLKSDGQFARDGFDALRDLDANEDGKIDALDPLHARLRVWRDLNQDGISQADELTTLDAQDIVAIHLDATARRKFLEDDNMQTASAAFSRAGGKRGEVANIDLRVDNFHRFFKHRISLDGQAMPLPDMQGAGRVRDLSEAIALSPELSTIAQTYSTQTTQEDLQALLDEFLEKWADTSEMKSFQAQADALKGQGVSLTYQLDGIDPGTTKHRSFLRKLGVVERFMGFAYGGNLGESRTEALRAGEGALFVHLNRQQILQVERAFERFRMDIYDTFSPLTQLAHYVELLLEGRLKNSYAALEREFSAAIAADVNKGVSDLGAFVSFVERWGAGNFRWDASQFLTSIRWPGTQRGEASPASAQRKNHVLTQDKRKFDGSAHAEFVIGTIHDDVLNGKDGDDQLFGNRGNDELNGGEGDDKLDGGPGDDKLTGGAGSNTYFFGRGDGADIISNNWEVGAEPTGTIVFKAGISPSDIHVQRDDFFGLLLKIKDTTDQLSVSGYFFRDCTMDYAVSQIRFHDGTIWSVEEIKERVIVSSDEDDLIYGYATNDTLDGGIGNDSLCGEGGNDILYGGSGDDYLNGDGGIDDFSLYKRGDLDQDQLFGGDGNDTLHGASGDDLLDGGTGNDSLYGGDGSDTYLFGRGDGQDTIHNNSIWDNGPTATGTITFKAGVTPSDIILSRNNSSLMLALKDSADVLKVNAYFNQDGNTDNAVAQIRFEDGTTWSVDDVKRMAIMSTGGDDTLLGYATDDILHGGAGDDRLHGNAGNDILEGGAGDDQLHGNAGNDILHGDAGDDQLCGDAGDDILHGGAGDDQLRGNAGDDILHGGAGDDQLHGHEGNDILHGGAGDDQLHGHEGNDILEGGRGNDTLSGGTGNNTYRFNRGDGRDTIWSSRYTPTDRHILLLSDIDAADQIWLRRDGTDLQVKLIGSDDMITVRRWYCGKHFRLDEIQLADGKTLRTENVESLVQSMAAFNPPSAAATSLPTQYREALAPLLAANWHQSTGILIH